MKFVLPLIVAGLCVSAFAIPLTQQTANEITGEREPKPARHTIDPGDCHTNGDGVEVCNNSTGNDKVIINPKNGGPSSATTVDVRNDADATVDNIDQNDTVNTAQGSTTEISGTGGTVNPAAGSSGSVTNTNPAGGGGASITISAGGVNIHVPPGTSVNFG